MSIAKLILNFVPDIEVALDEIVKKVCSSTGHLYIPFIYMLLDGDYGKVLFVFQTAVANNLRVTKRKNL